MPIIHTVRGRHRSGPHVFIAIPCHGEISAPTFVSFFEGAQFLDALGFNITLCVEAGNCHVDDARNSLVRRFIDTQCTDFVFIDADVGFRCEDLHKLVTVDRDIVAGVYPKKDDNEEFPVMVMPGEALWSDKDGLVEVLGVPTGFLRIKRDVLVNLYNKALHFTGSGGPLGMTYGVIFERGIQEGRRMSGDYAFCAKARAAGYRIFVDPEMQFSHTGAKTWSGTLGKWWKAQYIKPRPTLIERFKGYVAACKADARRELNY